MFKKRRSYRGKTLEVKKIPKIALQDEENSDEESAVTLHKKPRLEKNAEDSVAEIPVNQSKQPSDPQDLKLSNVSKEEATKVNSLAAQEDSNLEKPVNGVDSDSSVYKGTANYQTFLPKKDPKLNAVKISSNIKTTTVIDFQPDVCKDFQQHGYCGYGDTCKFLHVRDNFKKREVVQVNDWEVAKKSKLTLSEKKKSKKRKSQKNFLI